ncbi:MAG: leucine--tRNA ligase [Patescibacteria group bacterium]|nr:leucine--tRNA ligase [Patescibacteria group bacterium]
MFRTYNATSVEKKWQKKWAEEGLYKTDWKSKKPKYYNLVMFPYPSGDKLHIGHWYSYAPADSWGRYMRMNGFNVFEPIGFDSFGLPAENYAIKTGVRPMESIKNNVAYMRKQLVAMGTMYDWNQEVVTSNVEYYKWTQWVFLKLYEMGLAYKKKAPVNWCPKCKTVLANEQAQNGLCERCDSEVTEKFLSQWFFKIKDYAERLLDHTDLDWPEKTKTMQKNWIGKSKGSIVSWKVDGTDTVLDTYTTTIDTIYGVTFVVISPEHPALGNLVDERHKKSVEQYVKAAAKTSEIERTAEDREKTGVFTGAYVTNPLNGEKSSLWVADYVLMNYGTGVVMGVPAHDKRDYDFAKKYKLKIIQSIADDKGKSFFYDDIDKYAVSGKLVDSGPYTGMRILESRKKITQDLKKMGMGRFETNYKLRDWLISRQRYWGAPIPIVNCDKCGEVPIPEKDLPVELPKNVEFRPKGGKSPLSTSPKFVNTTCPKCKGPGTREVDTMDTFVCSSWYFLRYPSALNDKVPFEKNITKKWMPVDMYIGGPEHACMHLLYARFINMALKDAGYAPTEEPFKRLVHQGMITKDGAKMSKSKGNVVSPDDFIKKYGSDIFRMYMMFMGPFEQGGDFNDKGITGIARFLGKIYQLMQFPEKIEDKNLLNKWLHKTIKKVTEDVEKFHFNTAISALMEFVNTANKNGISESAKVKIVKIAAPLAPHFAEEVWREVLGNKKSVFDEKWPTYDSKCIVEDLIEMVIQINGKVRARMNVSPDISKDAALKQAKGLENVQKYLAEGKVMKEIFVPGKLVSFVVK